MGFFKEDKGGTKPDSQSSAQTWVPVSSSPNMPSIPSSKIGIETSAPANPHTLSRDVPGSMKQGSS